MPNVPKADDQYEIYYITEDGDAGLYGVGRFGKPMLDNVCVVNKLELSSLYKPLDKNQRLSIDEEYDSRGTYGIDLQMYHGIATVALTTLLHNETSLPKDAMYMQKSPQNKAIANKDMQPGELQLIPHTTSFKQTEEQPEIGITITHGTSIYMFSLEKPNKECQKGCYIEFWKLRRTGEKADSNMELGTIEIKVPLPKIGKLAKSVDVVVSKACLCKQVSKGDELVLYVPQKPKETKKRQMIAITKPVAKAKTSK